MEPTQSAPPGPPPDPEDWTDEQWLEWLRATDEAENSDGARHEGGRRAHRRGGALGAAMLGLRDAIYGRPDEEAAVVVDGSGDPPNDDEPQVLLDREHPERSQVVVHRPQNPAVSDESDEPRTSLPDEGEQGR